MWLFGYAYTGAVLVPETRRLFFTRVIVGFGPIGTKLGRKVTEKKIKYLIERFLKNTNKLFSVTGLYQSSVSCLSINLYNVLAISVVI
jgi:hypothetical protein